jgi:hypothetical protein
LQAKSTHWLSLQKSQARLMATKPLHLIIDSAVPESIALSKKTVACSERLMPQSSFFLLAEMATTSHNYKNG